MLDHLPTEIFIRILLNLPVESLLRCTAVCRSWHSLITGPSFIATQLRHRESDCQTGLLRHFCEGHLSLHSASFKLIESPLKQRDKGGYTRLVGSVHGLVCMTDDIGCYTDKTVIWNPYIRKHIELPLPSLTFCEVGPHYLALGFGYDRSTDDYKVVRVVYADGESHCYSLPQLAEVYAIKEKAWKRVSAVGVDSYICESSWTQCFLQGRVHWISYAFANQGFENSVLMFDMGDEKFRKMKLPNSLINVDPRKNLSVSEIRGFLTVLHYYYVGAQGKRHCDIWLMKVYDDVNSWSKVYTVDVLGASGIVLGLWGDEILLVKDYVEFHDPMVLWLEISNGEMISCNLKTHETRHFGVKGIIDARCYLWYSESLVLLDKDSGASSDGKNKEQHEKRSVTRGQTESNADEASEEERTSSSDTDD